MNQMLNDSNDYIILNSEKEGISCDFILKPNFLNGIIASESYHFHSTYEMHIPVMGTMHIMAKDQDILIHPGEVCIIPPDVVHYVFSDKQAFRTGFRFTFSHLKKEEHAPSSLFDDTYGVLTDLKVIEDCPIYSKYLAVAADNLTSPLPHFMTADLLFLALYEAASMLSHSHTYALQSMGNSDILLAEKIEEYLNTHYSQKFYLHDLAAYLNFSNRQTERILARLFGLSFSALVNKKRLTAAKLLLKTTDLPVEEIARNVGFPDYNYFYRKFSAAFSTTPGKYRGQFQK